MDLVSIADGNFTSSSTWAQTGHTLISTSTSATSLTTSPQDSASFIPAASAIIGMMLRLHRRDTPTSTTLTAILRNSTTATDVKTVVVTVADLTGCGSGGTDNEGGWIFVKFDSSHTPNGTDSYVVRLQVSGTNPTVQFETNGTAANWQRMMVLSTTAAPATGDDLHVLGEYDGSSNPATPGSRTVTMDQTSATDYGSVNTSAAVPALTVSNMGTLIYGTAGSTAYVLRISGWVKVFAGGTLNMGTTGTPIPRTSTAVLELDPTANNQMGVLVANGGTWTMQGLSRTSGKEVSWTLLTADLAASGTSSTVADDTGWLSGDEIGLASTSKTATEAEVVSLTANAGASSLSHGAVANAHLGTVAQKYQAEVVLLTRNVILRSTNASFNIKFDMNASAVVDCDWAMFRYCAGANNTGILVRTTTGSAEFTHCVARDLIGCGWRLTGGVTTGTVLVTYCTVYSWGTTSSGNHAFNDARGNDGISTGSVTWSHCVAIGDNTTSNNFCFAVATNGGSTYLDLHGSSSSYGFGMLTGNPRYAESMTITDLYMHSLANTAFHADCSTLGRGIRISGDLYCWRNTTGIDLTDNATGGRWTDVKFLGTTVVTGNTTGVAFSADYCGWVWFADLRSNSDTTFTQTTSVLFTGNVGALRVERYTSQATGLWTAPTNLFGSGGLCAWIQATFAYCANTESVEVNFTFREPGILRGSYIALQSRQADLTKTRVYTAVGEIDYETTIVDSAPGMKLSPADATFPLDTAAGVRGKGFLVGATTGEQPTITVMVRKDSSYNGAQPRLVLRTNDAMDVTSEQVLDTMSVGADTWETLSGQVPSTAPEEGVYELVVEGDGTAGAFYVDSWKTSGASGIDAGGLKHWMEGWPVATAGAVGGVAPTAHRLVRGGLTG